MSGGFARCLTEQAEKCRLFADSVLMRAAPSVGQLPAERKSRAHAPEGKPGSPRHPENRAKNLPGQT